MDSPVKQRITEAEFYGFMWTGVAISLIFIIVRLAIRWKVFKRLFWDDALVVLALLCFLASSIARTIMRDSIFALSRLEKGELAFSLDALFTVVRSFRVQLASLVLSTSCLWLINFSFLVFFRRLGSRVRKQKLWWWFVTGFTVATYLSFFGIVPYRCMTSDVQYVLDHCATPDAVESYFTLFRYQMAIDIITDLLIMSIPVTILWKVQIPVKQKLGLMCLFSLTMIVVIFASVRIMFFDKENKRFMDMAWVFFWSNMESTLALVIACLGSFRQLFARPEVSQNLAAQKPLLTSFRDAFEQFTSSCNITGQSQRPRSVQPAKDCHSQEHLHPLKSIYVSYEVEIKHNNDDPIQTPGKAFVVMDGNDSRWTSQSTDPR